MNTKTTGEASVPSLGLLPNLLHPEKFQPKEEPMATASKTAKKTAAPKPAAAETQVEATKRSPRGETVRFGFKDRYRIFTQMQTDYVSSRLTDVDYATYVSEKLGLAKVKASHIGEIRREFDMPANRTVTKEPPNLKALEDRITSIETYLAKQGYIPLSV